jgi:hypothetical protein
VVILESHKITSNWLALHCYPKKCSASSKEEKTTSEAVQRLFISASRRQTLDHRETHARTA